MGNPPLVIKLKISPIKSLLIGLFISVMANGLQGTLISLRANVEGFDEITVGIVMSFYFVGYILGTLFVSAIIERVGHIRAFSVLASIASATSLAHILIIDPISWSVFRIINGFCVAGLSVVIESWLNAHAVPNTRGKILSISGITTVAALALGQLLLNVAKPSEFTLFLIISIIFSFSLVPIALTKSVAPSYSGGLKFKLSSILFHFSKINKLGAIGIFLTGITMSSFLTLGPYFGQNLGLSVQDISIFMALIMLGTLVLQYPIGWLSDCMDRRKTIALISFMAFVSSALFVVSNDNFLILCIFAFFLGAFGQPLYAIVIAYVNDSINTKDTLSTTGLLLLLFGMGSVVGPLISSFFMNYIGNYGLFIFIALIYFLLFVITLFYTKHYSEFDNKQRYSNFVSVDATLPMGSTNKNRSK